MRRAVSLLLTILVIATLAIPAIATNEQPDSWAMDAVSFAVEHGLLSESDLRPKEAATRAELATMTVRLLDVQKQADLSGYSDVDPAAWYYADLAKAVQIGLLEGDGQLLQPNKTITREQAIVVLARCFGVPDGDLAVLEAYTDQMEISDWAAGTVAGMVEAGYVQGSGAKLRPLGTITRQELAQLIYNLAGTVVGEEEAPEEGNVTLIPQEDTVSNMTVNGDLFLGGDYEQLTLRNVRVSGRLVIHQGSVRLTGTSRAGEIVCCGEGVAVETDGDCPIRISGGSAEVTGGGDITAMADVTLRDGTYPAVKLLGAAVMVEEDARVTEARLEARDSHISGTGRIEKAVILQSGCTVEQADEVVELPDVGISQVQVSAAVPANEATPDAPAITTTVRFSNVDTTNCPGSENGVRYCTVSWYVDGVLEKKQRNFPLAEGAEASFQTQANYTGRVKPERTVLMRLTYGEETIEFSQTVNQHIEKLNSPVRTLEVEATVLRNTSMYGYLDLTGWICNVPAGTKAIYINYAGQSAGKIRLADGRTGWVRWSDLDISRKDYVQYTDYTQTEKENFVNIKGYESTSKYLVWISLLTQKVNVFEGSKQNWNLLHTFSCCTGKNTTPTIGGVFRYQSRQNYWDFGYYYVKRPMIFNGGHAFHTRTYVKSTGGLLDPTMGKPASQGCVRMYDADVDWLWNNMPFGTTVVVF